MLQQRGRIRRGLEGSEADEELVRFELALVGRRIASTDKSLNEQEDEKGFEEFRET